jgi:GntR family transcriptional regulator
LNFVGIDRNSPVPLYAQIEGQLRALILQQPQAGRPFHTDEALAKLFGVNRLTVRQAVKDLVDEGLLYRVRGLGTFVAGPKVEGMPIYPQGFLRQWSHKGLQVRVEVATLEPRPVPERAARALNLPVGTPMLYLDRLRFVNGRPVIVDYIYMPMAMSDHVAPADFSNEPLHFLLKRAGYSCISARLEIESVLAGDPEATRLEVSPGDPLLLRRIVLVGADGQAVTYGESFHRASMFKYTVEIPLSEVEW